MENDRSKEERRSAFHIMPAYKITEVGFDHTESIFLRTTIEMASGYDISEWRWVTGRDADVILVNSDHEESISEFPIDKPAQNQIRPILINCFSSGEKGDSFLYTLKKPVTYTMITGLLREIEREISAVIQISTPHTEQPEENSKEQDPGTSTQKPILSEARKQPEIHTFSTSHQIDDSQAPDDQPTGIDEDSDYDVYALLMDSEFDSFQPQKTSTQNNTNPQQAANTQDKVPAVLRRIQANIKIDQSAKRLRGLIDKHLLTKLKATGQGLNSTISAFLNKF
ncbi:MAG: hypothetical protein ABW098_19940 [Candidatus Thiodiazotropha sp.]